MPKKKPTITTHAKTRMKDRTGMGRKQDIQKEFNQALQNGDLNRIKNKEVKNYLLRKGAKKGKKVKFFNNKVFIHQGHTLITTYELPEKYKQLLEQDEKDSV